MYEAELILAQKELGFSSLRLWGRMSGGKICVFCISVCMHARVVRWWVGGAGVVSVLLTWSKISPVQWQINSMADCEFLAWEPNFISP